MNAVPLDYLAAGGRSPMLGRFLLAVTVIQRSKEDAMTKAEEVFTKVEELVAGGMSKAQAFEQLAQHYQQPVNSVRGSYYQHTRKQQGGGRPRRRETTADDAVADARRALERAIENIDREIDEAKRRAEEAKREYDALKASASERKTAIASKLKALA